MTELTSFNSLIVLERWAHFFSFRKFQTKKCKGLLSSERTTPALFHSWYRLVLLKSCTFYEPSNICPFYLNWRKIVTKTSFSQDIFGILIEDVKFLPNRALKFRVDICHRFLALKKIQERSAESAPLPKRTAGEIALKTANKSETYFPMFTRLNMVSYA